MDMFLDILDNHYDEIEEIRNKYQYIYLNIIIF